MNTKDKLKTSLGKVMKPKFIVGISGISGSGKTLLTKELIKKIKVDKVIHIDNYWKEHKSIPKLVSEWRKWERPSNIKFSRLYKDIFRLKKKGYSVLVEGFYLYYRKEIRDLFDFKIYITLPNEFVIKRRIKKFGFENNQEFYSREILIKEYEKYGKPSKKYADLILDGTKPIKESAMKINKAFYKMLK